jgi:glutamate formiminotransferase
MVECVVNVSEGRDETVLATLVEAAGPPLLDLHRDPHHHRSVLTLAGPADAVAEAARTLARAAVARLDLRDHRGVHPRLGVLDVVPFVPFEPGRPAPHDLASAVALRDDFARWLGAELGVPSFLYGPLPDGEERTLPEVRRRAFRSRTGEAGASGDAGGGGLAPDFGPPAPDPRTGATAVGARQVLVAYNVWVSSAAVARAVAAQVRQPGVRALGLEVGDRAQVSCNLVEPEHFGPGRLYDEVATLVEAAGGAVEGAELVGLVPEVVLAAVPAGRRAALGLSDGITVESRLAG